MKTKTIRQTIEFNATPEHIYTLLMNSKQHTAFTGDFAKITNRVGGKFIAGNGYISGKNIELINGKKIVQQWTCKDFPEGHTTLVTYNLKEIKKGTQLKFIQEGVPAQNYDDIYQGWIDFYWEKMKAYFAK